MERARTRLMNSNPEKQDETRRLEKNGMEPTIPEQGGWGQNPYNKEMKLRSLRPSASSLESQSICPLFWIWEQGYLTPTTTTRRWDSGCREHKPWKQGHYTWYSKTTWRNSDNQEQADGTQNFENKELEITSTKAKSKGWNSLPWKQCYGYQKPQENED